MEYNFSAIESKWQDEWRKRRSYKTEIDPSREKYYVLDMFPYPSGAGLHVGHPLGYIASDIVARYKRLKGFNVLHPMGYDAFGLPAEQYAIQTGQHPKVTTEQNIKRYREQLDKIGFCFDWSREVRTCEPEYYKWTQWIFIQLFHSWYNCNTQKAEPIANLIATFEREGLQCNLPQYLTGDIEQEVGSFSAEDWKSFSEKKKSDILLNFRLAYLSEAWVNWCPALGTVLANDEVKDGVSERGGYPVERKQMPQWSLRITAYADRLLNDLENLDWSESIKEAQRNWIGKSEGTSIIFQIEGREETIEVFTTRPDTVFGVSFVTLAPEHELVNKVTVAEYRNAVDEYVTMAKNRSERERMADVKRISGQFTGAYVKHPFTGAKIPVWIGDYVLAGYGTGAVMAVPAHDSRDYGFAKHFESQLTEQLGRSPFLQVIEAPADKAHEGYAIASYDEKYGNLINSDFLNGKEVKEAITAAIAEIENRNIGQGRTNYRLRDAAFGRQRYWGEPIPVYYKDGIPQTLDASELPLILPEIDKYQPTESGEPPLARAKDWKYKGEYEYEATTMPGWAGSSWYFLRYMDANNDKELVSKEAVNYWKNVDFYLGGSEHATGHLLYVRFWTKFLYDLGIIPMNEPAQKLINQGMIQGRSNYIIRYNIGSGIDNGKIIYKNTELYLSLNLAESILKGECSPIQLQEKLISQFGIDFVNQHPELNSIFMGVNANEEPIGTERRSTNYVDVKYVKNDILNVEAVSEKDPRFKGAFFLREDDGKFHCGVIENEKMSKSKFNVVTPDDIIEEYGADTLRLYEMFLGPLEQSKPWSTQGISGVHNFLRRLWRLFHDKDNNFSVSNEEPTKAELKTLHKTIKKVEEDVERFSFNTTISNFMICVNELTDLKCNKRSILEPLMIILSPYAPHFAEELWEKLGYAESVTGATFPQWKEEYLTENEFEYPVSINGKVKMKLKLSLQLSKEEIEQAVLTSDEVKKFMQDAPKKLIVVPGRIVNIVI